MSEKPQDWDGVNRRKSAFDWVKLFLTNWTAAKGIVVALTMLLGAGTVTNPAVQERLGFADTPIPKGQTPTPEKDSPADVWRGQVDQSLKALVKAVDDNTAEQKALRLELDEMRQQLEAQRERGDDALRRDIDELKKLVN